MPFFIDGLRFDETATDPLTPYEGQLWYNTLDHRLKLYASGVVRVIAHLTDITNPPAANVTTDTTNFGGILSTADTDVQKALDTIDNRIYTGTSTPGSPVDGTLWYNTTAGWNTMMVYDSSRSKWLSTTEFTFGWGHNSPDNKYLNGYGISAIGVNGGLLIPRNCCIKRISARCTGGNTTKRFDVYANGASVLNFSLATSGGFGVYHSNAVNQNLAENDYVWLLADAAGAASTDVVVVLWCSWRV